MNKVISGRKRKRSRFPILAKLALLAAFVLLLWILAQAVEESPGFQALPEAAMGAGYPGRRRAAGV